MKNTDPSRRDAGPIEPGSSAQVPGSKRLQMADIARMAGVSTTTVSRALSGSSLVNKATRKRVTELARSLNYTVNAGAKELRLGHSTTVAVTLPYDARMRRALSDPISLGILGSIADALAERGYEMLLSRLDVESLPLAATPYDSGRAMGIILIGMQHRHDDLNQLAARGVPLVVWGAQLPNQLYCTIGGDDLEGGRVATAHLLTRGRRRIAFLGDLSVPEMAQRHEGYRQALTEAGVGPDAALLSPVPLRAESARDAVLQLKARSAGFDAVFCCSDLMAVSAISTLRSLGVRVPQEVSVIGFDDSPLAALFDPPITTVRQPIEHGGRALVEALLSFHARSAPPPQVLPVELIIRGSA
jgi:DNA-binding LacI/PurR family transcriptional regulator